MIVSGEEYLRLPSPDVLSVERCRKYKITQAVYDIIWKAQDGLCAICFTPNPRSIDHNHKTGHIRGLLCSRCNAGLGMFQDDPNKLDSAKRYLAHSTVSKLKTYWRRKCLGR